MALNTKGKPIASPDDYRTFFGSQQGLNILADLEAQFETNSPSFRTEEILADPEAAETFAKLRDGAREVILYIRLRAQSNETPTP